MPKIMKKKHAGSCLTADKRKSLQDLAAQFNAKLKGDGRITLGKDATPMVKVCPPLLSLNYVTGGGVPKGRYTELYGAESVGKSLLTLNAIAGFQEQGLAVGLISREEFDLSWAASNGVRTEDMLFVETATGDTSLQVAVEMVEQGALDLIVFDSVQAFDTTQEAKDSVEKPSYGGGGAAQMWGRMMRKAYSMANQGSPTAYIGISQARTKIGGFSPNGVPDPEPTGIMAIRHWKSISVQCKKGEQKPEYVEKSATGRTRVLTREFKLNNKKNKCGPSHRSTSYLYHFHEHDGIVTGFDYAEDAFRMARVYEVITNSGNWYYHEGKRLANGAVNVVNFIRKDQKLLDKIRGEVFERIKDDK